MFQSCDVRAKEAVQPSKAQATETTEKTESEWPFSVNSVVSVAVFEIVGHPLKPGPSRASIFQFRDKKQINFPILRIQPMSIFRSQYIRTLLAPGLFLACLSTLPAQQKKVDLRPQTVATFNGTNITEEELRKAAADDLDQLHLQVQQMNANLARAEHEILETNLIRLLADKLFEAEAAKKGISKEVFLENELKGKVKEPSQQEIKAFYDANKPRYNQPLEKVTDEIRQYLKMQSRNRAVGELADRLKADYAVSMLLLPLRSKVGTEGSPSLGPKEAPVTIVVFSDYQSAFCSQLSKTLREVVTKYGDEVRLVYRQFPLSQVHPYAEKAAEASLCAADQNHFWEMHDLLFETQTALTDNDLVAKAAKLKLDSGAFGSCLASGKYAEKVKQDRRDGFGLGVAATPALFINGRFLSGALPISDLSKTIDEEIRIKSLGTAAAAGAARMP
jgi:protein-disulfide isomerase